MTLGIELLLAADIRIAATGTRFTQLEVQRGIYPFGGATIRLPREAGWGNAMRWLLTGDEFDAAEAHRIGLVQEVADDAAAALARAREIAHTIADRAAPLGVRATLASAPPGPRAGEAAAIERLRPGRDRAVRQRGRRRGRAVVHRATRRPIPGPLTPNVH